MSYLAAEDVDLSAFRFQLNPVDHVVIVGDPPPVDPHEELRSALAAREPTVVAEEAFRLLHGPETAATQAGSWVIGQYRTRIDEKPCSNRRMASQRDNAPAPQGIPITPQAGSSPTCLGEPRLAETRVRLPGSQLV